MNRRTINLLCGVALAAVPLTLRAAQPLLKSSTPAPAPADLAPTLRWNNGDTLQGELLEASSTGFSWKTPLFDAPMELAWSAFSRIDQTVAAKAAPEEFGIALRDGSYILGNLVGISEDAVSIHSTRHGDAILKRGEVSSIRRLQGKTLFWAGPSGAVGWEIVNNRNSPKKGNNAGKPIPLLVGTAGGTLSLPYFNRGAALDVQLPELVDVEFHLRSSVRPDFQFLLGGDKKKDNLRIETWDDELVLAAGDQFCPVRKLADDERTLNLRVSWDRKERRCVVFTTSGERLAEWTAPEDNSSEHRGVVLQNKGRDLSLEFLRIQTWDRKPPAAVDQKKPRVELADGRIINIESITATDGSTTIRAATADASENLPLADLQALYLAPAAAPPPAQPPATFSFADGTFLPEEINSIKDGAASLKTTFTEKPLYTRMDGFSQLRIKPPGAAGEKSPVDTLDTLKLNQTTMRGKAVFDGKNVPLWLPVGGTKATPLGKSLSSEIIRALPGEGKLAAAPALFYTGTGDVLPGLLHAIDRSGVDFESPVVAATKLAPDNIDAIQFGAGARLEVSGFSDPSWQILKGDEKTVQREAQALKMEPDTSLGNAYAMQGTEVSFAVAARNYGAIRLRMFCAGVEPKGSTNLMLMISGGTVYSGIEMGDNQLEDRVQTNFGNGPLKIRLTITDSAVELYLNDGWAQKFDIAASKRPGYGLIVEPGSLFGNQVRPIALSHFAAKLTPGQMPMSYINPEARMHALTVPRFLKDDQPRQALLARNGDVLRGEIEASTKSHLGFRSGLENLNVPLDRVEAAIWLKKPSPPASAGEKPPAPAILEQAITRKVKLQNVELRNAVNFLKSLLPELVIKMPEDNATAKAEAGGADSPEGDNRRVAKLEIGGATLAKALDQICSAFELSYKVNADNSIVLIPGKTEKKELVEKKYWLKGKPFSGANAVTEILTAKGIGFPPGASAAWQESQQLLTMTNSVENQQRLAAVLESDFGGVTEPPTHWLLLANGGRLGLKVDRFDPDAIIGRHPSYGACRVPVQEVAAIRTSAPPPSAAIRSFGDWRLVLAPEPVLPEAGGENSPLLGKMAKPFKVPLMGGGEFDLTKEKGKVVVLDFWATWCGPCIKSLPGTISAVAGFSAEQVRFVAVNQSEPEEQVKRFVEARGWKLPVGMDSGSKVGHDYGADAIPHMVIVGQDGKVAWVKTGSTPDGETEITNAVKKLLGSPVAKVEGK